MPTVASGLKKRFQIVDSDDFDDSTSADQKRAVQAELDTDKPLKNEKFKNSKLQETVISYINVLNDSMDVLNNYQYNSDKYDDHWNEVYNKRTTILKTMVDNYGLRMSGSDQANLNDLVANGKATVKANRQKETLEKMIEGAKFEKTDEDGEFAYSATVKNTSNIAYKDISLVVSLYDANNVKTEENAYVESWQPGETVKFEAYSEVDSSNVKASVDYYNVADD